MLVKSSNIGMSMLGERMGKHKLYHALSTASSFGHPTGIELPGEDPGLREPAREVEQVDSTDSVAQGYEVMVTPLQLARGFCAYANGGRLVQPTLVKGVLDADGEIVVAHEATDGSKLMPEVDRPAPPPRVRRILCDVVIRGTASRVRAADVGTSSARPARPTSARAPAAMPTSTPAAIGGAPSENPQLVVAMIIHEPDAEYAKAHNMSYYGGAVAAPGATRLIDRALAYLQVPASPGLPPPPPAIAAVLYDYHANLYGEKSASARD